MTVNEKAYDDPGYVKSAEAFAREIAPAVGGLPITVRLFKPRNYLEAFVGGKPVSKDIAVN